MVRRLTVLALALTLTIGGPLTLPAAAQQNRTPLATVFSIPVVGAVTGAASGVFNGIATITGFARVPGQNGQPAQLVALGTLTGTVSNTVGGVTTVISSLAANFSVPVIAAVTGSAAAPCSILNLVLGPLHIDVLGLVIDLPNQLIVNITAVPGAGNLLGNLLCAVAGLLDSGGLLQQLANALNAILASL